MYGAATLYSVPGSTVIALQTATFILAASLGLMAAAPEHGLLRLLFDERPAGILARRAGPAFVAIPLVLGLLTVAAARNKIGDPVFLSALRTLVELALITTLLFWTGRAINAEAERRQEVQNELLASERRLVETLEAMSQRRAEIIEREVAARAEAEKAARLKDEFLATVSHELRTPLNAVVGWAQILATDSLDPTKVRRAAEVIERNAKAQAQLVTDLLDVSQIISGKMHLDTSLVDVGATVTNAVESIQPTADAKRITLERKLPENRIVTRGDAGRLQQVVWNLLSNAIKFTPAGGRVCVEVEQRDAAIALRVADNGVGISPDFLPHVFDRFRQADGSTSRSHGGLGLGLAIVKQLAELHGGTAAVESDGKGRGATFIVTLPTAIAGVPPPSPSSASAATPPTKPPLSGVRVLVVEDDHDARALLARVLEESGATVSEAASAEEALDALRDQELGVIVSDIGMPEMDGYELIAAVREKGITIPAIALTAFVRSEDRARALEAGFQAHLSKPLQPAELISTLASLLEGSASESARGEPAAAKPAP
ncbi:MAG: response regulator [Myxococcales bacterium]|nr:response regulator [Myxococcales bacterium]